MPKKTKALSTRLAGNAVRTPASSPSPSSPPTTSSSFGYKLLGHPDLQEACAMVAEQAGLEYDMRHGAALLRHESELVDLDQRYAASSASLEELETRKRNTDRYKKGGAAVAENGDPTSVPFSRWHTKDKILLIVTSTLCVLAACLGAANVYSALMASSLPVFIEDPWLAATLSTLLPIGAASIKFFTHFLAFDRDRRRFTLGVFAATLIALLAWSVLFSMNYSGVSGAFDWDDIGQSSATGSALVWTQLLVEMLAATALWMAAEQIALRYAPDAYSENVEYFEIERALKPQTPIHTALVTERATKRGQVAEMKAARAAFINEAVAALVDLYTKRAQARAVLGPA